MSPMLLAGLFTALSGITELLAPRLGEMGHVTHTISMFLTAIFLIYGIYGYHNMLNKTIKT
jgi:hypothetical protein